MIKEKTEKINSVIHPGKLVPFYDVYVYSNVKFEEPMMIEGHLKYDMEAIDTISLLSVCDSNIFVEASGGLGKTFHPWIISDKPKH